MIQLRERVAAAAEGVCIAQGIEDLRAIHKPGCAAAIWQRPAEPVFAAWIWALDMARLPTARVVLKPNRVARTLEECCEIARTPNGPERAALIADAAKLAGEFAQLMKAPGLRLRFDVVTTNACRKFHVDVLTARLICTYRGTGTQYGLSLNGAEPDDIFTVPTGSPIILRGKLWPEHPSAGVRHRSPPIEGTGETRLVLVLDPVYDLCR